MSVVTDVERAVQIASGVFGTVRSTNEWYKLLTPLRDAALLGDPSALARLNQYATTDPIAGKRAAAILLVGEVQVRQSLGKAAAGAGVTLYPGQVVSPALIGLGLLLLFMLWKGRK